MAAQSVPGQLYSLQHEGPMTHVPTANTFELLKSYYLCPERKAFTRWQSRERTRSRKIRRGPGSVVDFSDPESECVLDAIADALLHPLALQAARDDDEAEWLANQQGCP